MIEDGLSVKVKANTDEFGEGMEEATEAVEELQAALERLERAGIPVSIGPSDKEVRISLAIERHERKAQRNSSRNANPR